MPYIARTDGGNSVLELRQGVLEDVAESDRSNWRTVRDTPPTIDHLTQVFIRTGIIVLTDTSVEVQYQIFNEPEDVIKERLKQYAADRSWRKREAGLTLPTGVRVDTSADSLTMIIGAVQSLERGYVQEPVSFCAMSGPVQATLDDLKGVWAAIAAYTEASFAARSACFAAIDAGTITTSAQVDAAV